MSGKGQFAQDYDTDQATIKSLRDLGERTTAAKTKLYHDLDSLAPGLIGAAGSSAQNFKAEITAAISQINKIGDDIADALVSATNQSSADDADAAQQLNKQAESIGSHQHNLANGQ